ncbi:MAG: ATP-binding protein [Candidatus Omnitrophota bacterium]
MKLTLQTKYSLTIFISILLALILLTGAVLLRSKFAIQKIITTNSRIMEEGLFRQLESRAEEMTGRLSSDLVGPMNRRDLDPIKDIVWRAKRQQDISYIYVFDAAGRIIDDGTDEGLLRGNVLKDAVSRNAVAASVPLFQFTQDTLDASAPIVLENEIVGGVRVGFFLKTVMMDIDNMKGHMISIGRESAKQNILIIAITAVILLMLGVIVSIAIAKVLSRPIDVLSSFTKRYDKGDYDVAIPVDRSDEIGQLGNALNKITQNLRETTFSRDFLNSILRSMVDPLIVTNANQVIMMVNKATCYLLGYKKEEELIGQPLETVFGKVIKESDGASRLIKLINQGIMYYETLFQSKHGDPIPVLVSGSSIRDDNNNVIWTICTAVDISKRKKAEEQLQSAYTELKDTQSQLIQVEKMDAIGRMASGIAHEVKNPLGVILQGVNCLEMRLPPAQRDVFDILQKIKNNVARADNIIKGLLDFSKLTELKIEPEDVKLILDSSLGLIQHRVKLERIDVIKKFKEDIPNVLADKRKLEQVFVNILLNAVQAMPNGGTLFIRLYKAKLDGKEAAEASEISTHFASGEEVVVAEIEDTGIGISKGDIHKIYEPFFTTKSPQEGTGLGLSVTRNIIDTHKGYLDIKSKKDKGTKATVFLKVVRGGK